MMKRVSLAVGASGEKNGSEIDFRVSISEPPS